MISTGSITRSVEATAPGMISTGSITRSVEVTARHDLDRLDHPTRARS
jgi:hypothetical protein